MVGDITGEAGLAPFLDEVGGGGFLVVGVGGFGFCGVGGGAAFLGPGGSVVATFSASSSLCFNAASWASLCLRCSGRTPSLKVRVGLRAGVGTAPAGSPIMNDWLWWKVPRRNQCRRTQIPLVVGIQVSSRQRMLRTVICILLSIYMCVMYSCAWDLTRQFFHSGGVGLIQLEAVSCMVCNLDKTAPSCLLVG